MCYMMLLFPHVSSCFDGWEEALEFAGRGRNRAAAAASAMVAVQRAVRASFDVEEAQKEREQSWNVLCQHVDETWLNCLRIGPNHLAEQFLYIFILSEILSGNDCIERICGFFWEPHRKHLMLWEHLAMPWFGMSPSDRPKWMRNEDVSPNASPGLNREALPVSQNGRVWTCIPYTYLESLTVRRMFGCLGAARKCLQRDPEVASNRQWKRPG